MKNVSIYHQSVVIPHLLDYSIHIIQVMSSSQAWCWLLCHFLLSSSSPTIGYSTGEPFMVIAELCVFFGDTWCCYAVYCLTIFRNTIGELWCPRNMSPCNN